jgi:hypothetical protein
MDDTNNNNSQEMMMMNNEDNESRSSDNDNGGGSGGQLATMPNGYPSPYDNASQNNNAILNDLGSSSNDYPGYPMSFLSKSKNDNDTINSNADSPRFALFSSLFSYSISFCFKYFKYELCYLSILWGNILISKCLFFYAFKAVILSPCFFL